MEWYLKVMKENYANFNGRARRKEYWMFTLFYMIVLTVSLVLDALLGTFGLLYIIVALAHIIPSLALAARRMHDIGKSGWFLLVSFIPFIGGIWLLILLCTDGIAGDNEYGSNPKTEEVVA